MSSISAMITTLKNNKRERVSALKKLKEFKEGKNIRVYFDKTATPHQLKNIREKLQKENNKKLKRNIVIFTILITLLIYVIGFVKF